MARTVVRRRTRDVIIGAAHAIAADAAQRVHALLEARVVAARGAAGAGIDGAPRIVICGLRMAHGRGGKNGGGDDGGLEQAHATSPGDEPSSHSMNTARLRLISPNQGAPAWALTYRPAAKVPIAPPSVARSAHTRRWSAIARIMDADAADAAQRGLALLAGCKIA